MTRKVRRLVHKHKDESEPPYNILFTCSWCMKQAGVMLAIKCRECGGVLYACNECAVTLGLILEKEGG